MTAADNNSGDARANIIFEAAEVAVVEAARLVIGANLRSSLVFGHILLNR